MGIDFSTGLFAGILSALLIYLLVAQFTKKEKLNNNDFDERQELIRGKAYKYGFFTMIIMTLFVMAAIEFNISLPVTASLAMFIALLISIDVYAVYSIINDAYFGVGTNKMRYCIFFVIIIALNLVGGASNLNNLAKSGERIVLGFSDAANLCVALAFLPILVIMIVKILEEKKELNDEES